jgi:hypothetical protein
MEILYSFWWWYFFPGIAVSVATLMTEAIMLYRAPPKLPEQPNRILTLAFVFFLGLWKWPLLAFGAFAAYVRGDTLLISFYKNQQLRSKIAARELPFRRSWVKTEKD